MADIGRWQVYSLEAYALRVRADPEFIRRTQPLFANFLGGLTSPDEMQRKRFDDLAVVLGEQTLDDVRVLLPLKRRLEGLGIGTVEASGLFEMQLEAATLLCRIVRWPAQADYRVEHVFLAGRAALLA